jgi:hypothetical protein
MARWQKINQFLVLNGEGKIQPDLGEFPADAYFDTRENCEIEMDLEIERDKQLNCNGRDIYGEPTKSRYRRFRLNYNSPTPQQIFRHVAYFAGAVDDPVGSPANEVQFLSKSGTTSSGSFKLAMTLEGRSGVSKPVPVNPTVAQLIAAITSQAATLGKIIQPGDITGAGGTAQVETNTVVGTIDADGNIPVTVRAANSVALAAGKTVQVAVLNGDSASVVGGKIRAALAADTDVNAFFIVSGTGANYILTARTRAANDTAMNAGHTNGTATGLTPSATSVNTTPGVAQTEFGSGIFLTYAKRLRNADLPLLTVDNSLIVGGGTYAVAQTTPGAQNFHAAQRTDDSSKVLFGLALGNKADSTVTEKYGDAVSESINFTVSADQTNVTMQVVICCNFNPDTFTSFSVPACTNEPPVLAVDTRLKIDGVYRNRNLVSHAVALNDNVPVAAGFGFDDIDVSVPFVAGDEPTQEFTTELFYDHADSDSAALRTLALDEFVEGNEVEFITHLGNPGNRVSIIAGDTKIKPQGQLDGFSGSANQSTIRLIGTPYGKSDIPIRFEAMLDQGVSFLQS